MSAPPDLSVIIVNRNTRELLRACLSSLLSASRNLTVETIVVDNGSDDGSPEMVTADFSDVSLIRNPTNTGFAHPNNQGLAVARGRYLMLLNSDTEVAPDSLDRLVSFMDSTPNAGACGPSLVYPDGRMQVSCFSHHTPWRYACDMLDLGKVFPRSRLFANQRTWFGHDRTAEVDWVMGAAIVVRRAAMEEVGVLDERFSIHGNESDWCYRLHRAGWKVYFVHDARVMHHLGGTRRLENGGMAMQREMVQNEFDYYRKHFGHIGFAWYRLWTVIGFAPRLLRYRRRMKRGGGASDAALAHFCGGMLRAGLTGDPDQFGARGGAGVSGGSRG